MNKNYLFLMLIVAFAACKGKMSNESFVYDDEVFTNDAFRDSTIYGFCSDATNASKIQIITDGGDTLTINISEAREKDLILGGYERGDEMAIVTNADSTKAVCVINKTALLGNWVMTNPMDGSSETGISILRGGSAESIDQNSIIYKSWRIYNGMLQLTATRDDGIDMDETEEFYIRRITADSLVIENDDEILEYTRQDATASKNSTFEAEDYTQDDFIM